MTAAKEYLPHYTVADYRKWKGDWELWAGIPVPMTPSPFGRHQAVASRIFLQLQNQLDASSCGAQAVYDLDWIISDDTVLRPDVMVICGGIPEHFLRSAPALVVEVISEQTSQRDRTYKRDLYADQGVDVYLLADPGTRTLEIYQRDASGRWQDRAIEEAVEFRICDDRELRLERESLFRQ